MLQSALFSPKEQHINPLDFTRRSFCLLKRNAVHATKNYWPFTCRSAISAIILRANQPFMVWTDHKPLCGALSSSAERSPRQTRHLSYISEFTTDIRHVPGPQNVVADLLSRPPLPQVPAPGASYAQVAAAASPVHLRQHGLTSNVDLRCLARHQFRDKAEFQPLRGSGSDLRLKLVDIPSLPAARILCDVSQAQPRHLVPHSWTKKIFDPFHGLSHGGGRASLRDIKPRFVWPGMSSDILRWARECPDCAASKISRHVHFPLTRRPVASLRFGSIHVDLVGPLPESEGMRCWHRRPMLPCRRRPLAQCHRRLLQRLLPLLCYWQPLPFPRRWIPLPGPCRRAMAVALVHLTGYTFELRRDRNSLISLSKSPPTAL